MIASSSTRHFILLHGWGFSATTMQPLAQALSKHFPAARITCPDLGFFGVADWPKIDSAQPTCLIGHSYGFAYLCQQVRQHYPALQIAAWVSICGFRHFCRQAGAPDKIGTALRTVDAMLTRLSIDCDGTLQDFYQRCGYAVSPSLSAANLNTLIKHLRELRDTKISLPTEPLLALAAAQDQIVSAELSRACFANPLFLVGPHALPSTHAAACAAQIAQWSATA